MTKTILLALLIAGALIFGSISTNEAFAAVDMFMKIKGVDGEATDKAHKDWINLLSVNWSIATPTAPGGGGEAAGPPKISEITVKNVLDKSSPKLFEAAITGSHHDDVQIDFCSDSDKGCYLKYTLTKVIITSYNFDGSSSDDQLTESVTLNFEEIKVTYTKFDNGKSTGETVEFGWNVASGERV